jgi:hypothetical protein
LVEGRNLGYGVERLIEILRERDHAIEQERQRESGE